MGKSGMKGGLLTRKMGNGPRWVVWFGGKDQGDGWQPLNTGWRGGGRLGAELWLGLVG
jgi:hypothetical protein